MTAPIAAVLEALAKDLGKSADMRAAELLTAMLGYKKPRRRSRAREQMSPPGASFVGTAGRWSFDAASITGLSNRDVGVKCAEPELGADDVVVPCSCINPKNPGDLPEGRWVRFSWRKGAIVAE